jgi:hypothetical protein
MFSVPAYRFMHFTGLKEKDLPVTVLRSRSFKEDVFGGPLEDLWVSECSGDSLLPARSHLRPLQPTTEPKVMRSENAQCSVAS